jgi:hypothetical protein
MFHLVLVDQDGIIFPDWMINCWIVQSSMCVCVCVFGGGGGGSCH